MLDIGLSRYFRKTTMSKVRSVLIVDDSETDTEIAEHYLRASGRFDHVLTVNDGQEALELFQHPDTASQQPGFPPSVVLLDLQMPRMNGFEFLEHFASVAERYPDTAIVVMLASQAFDAKLEQAAESGPVHSHLYKPLTLARAQSLADRFAE